MLSQLEQACKTYSTEFSCGLIEFDSDWQRIFVTALTFHLDQAIPLVPAELTGCGYPGLLDRKNRSDLRHRGSRTIDFLRERRTPYPLSQALRDHRYPVLCL